MEWKDLLSALALLLVIEGIMPFAAPSVMKQTLASMVALDFAVLRKLGFASMAVGLGILYWVRG